MSEYLPQNCSVLDTIKKYKKRTAYKIWKRKIKKYSGFQFKKNSYPSILEIGSGAGLLLHDLVKWYNRGVILGGDYRFDHLNHIKRTWPELSTIQFDAQSLPFKKKSFDILISIQVVEHLENPSSFINEASRLLKLGGLLIISTPNPKGLAAKVLKNKWQGVKPDHVSLLHPNRWRCLLTENGFQILNDGTTGLTGFKSLRFFPLSLVNYVPMVLWGFFPWDLGESYMALSKKIGVKSAN